MSVKKEIIRDLRIIQGDYDKFRNWYFKEYGKETYDNYKDFHNYLTELSDLESFLRAQEEFEEWKKYRSQMLKTMEKIEEDLTSWMCDYIQRLQEYGYIYDARNMLIGDSPEFFVDQNKSYFVEVKTYELDIGEVLIGESAQDVKKKNARRKFSESMLKLLDAKIESTSVNGNLSLFKKSVKIVFDGLLIKETSNGHKAVIRLGIKAL